MEEVIKVCGLREKLSIRRMKESDFRSLHELLSDKDVMRYIEPVFTMEQTVAFLNTAGLSAPPLIYAVDDDQGRFIGYVIYHDYDPESMEVGWVLKKDAWGKGYATALTAKLIELTRSRGKNAVIECSSEQIVTKRIAEKFGFDYTGQRDGCNVYKLSLRRK